MGFLFRFEALLTYRAHRKERAEVALGKARQRLRQAVETLEGLRSRRKEAGEELATFLRQKPSADLLRNYVDFLSSLKGRIQGQKKEISAREKAVRERLNEVLARTREYRIIEKLKERDYKTWLQEQRRQEQKVLDENAIVRHGRTFS
jgi:flagellar FliJ protein